MIVLFSSRHSKLRSWEKQVQVINSSGPLLITMGYNDFSREDLINDLDLFANDQAGSFFVGNDFAGSDTPDVVNNGEGNIIENPAQGTWSK